MRLWLYKRYYELKLWLIIQAARVNYLLRFRRPNIKWSLEWEDLDT